ncbi:MAG: maleylpyruvate isomerase N-terminal domain-containing protein, partial [Actinomycetota bacterium]|nr:maleylpyruvate isomerase N-terminal domain-containing protein [Actinomycetota bacterium]
MEFETYVDQVREQARALRAAAVKAGPDTDVPTTPGWTVLRLVQHVAGVHGFVVVAMDTDPAAVDTPPAQQPPEAWDAVIGYWDDQVDALVTGLRERGAAGPAWTFDGTGTAGSLVRRLAHETAIHRLDAEHAVFGDTVAQMLFDPVFAADGVDEALTVLMPERPAGASGTVLFHATDVDRAWLVEATEGQPPTA